MSHPHLQKNLSAITDSLVASINAHDAIRHYGEVTLPDRDTIVRILVLLQKVIYPGYFGLRNLTESDARGRISERVEEVSKLLYEQVRCALRYRANLSESDLTAGCEKHDQRAAEVVVEFLGKLPAIRELLASDVEATVRGDPAADNAHETVLCYPGVQAITIQRVAHELYKLDVPLIPRIMTEHAHSITGVDIHPGARIGGSFCIDHGTGIVIGETTVIGNGVRIYQGVTLGGLILTPAEMKHARKRHPTIEDNVTIFSGTTILGGKTVIGKGSIISGNVFITKSVPAMHEVPAQETHPRTFNLRDESWNENYQI